MWIWGVLGVVFVAAPLLCWALMARTTVVSAVVGVLLFGCAWLIVAADQGWIATRAELELDLGYAPVTGLLITAAAFTNHRRGSRVFRKRAMAGGSVLGLYVVAVAALGSPCYMMFRVDDTLFPSRTEILPLPDGLTVAADSGDVEECSHICDRTLRIGSDRGLTPDQVERRLRDSLRTDHGWQLGPDGTACRPHGWWLDRRTVCLALTRTGDGAQVYLQGYEPHMTPQLERPSHM
jgi:hypothetical protein